MMMPRLKLLRELLRDDGVIFVSIDDNEIHHLRMLLDEVFGEENFITNFIWKKKSTSTNVEGVQISSLTDCILAYGKTYNARLIPRIRSKDTRSYPHKDTEGEYRLMVIEKKHAGAYQRDSMRFPILGVFPRQGKRWQIGKEKAEELGKMGRFVLHNGVVKLKIYRHEDKDTFSAQPNLLDSYGSTDSAQKMLTEVFGQSEIFDNPKPIELVKHLALISSQKEDLILDSFAGSGTTAHAVLALNKEDGGNRKFVLVECEDYADKITAERVRRVIRGVKATKDDNLKNGLGGSFSFFELGKSIDVARILKGKDLPSFTEMARYIFYTATGEEFNEKKVDEKSGFIGESKTHKVYLLYKPDLQYLKSTALTLDFAQQLGKFTGKKRLVFAPTKYLDQEHLERFGIEFAQLPFDIYNRVK